MHVEIKWWMDRLLTLAKIAGVVCVTAATVAAGGWFVVHFMQFVKYDWESSALAAGAILFLAGAVLNWLMHDCQYRKVFRCDSCEQNKNALNQVVIQKQSAESRERYTGEILKMLVFGDQDELDELLGIFGERAYGACKLQLALNNLAKEGGLSPKQMLELQLLTNKIAYYHKTFQKIRESVPFFQLTVSQGWSAYFPKQEKAN